MRALAPAKILIILRANLKFISSIAENCRARIFVLLLLVFWTVSYLCLILLLLGAALDLESWLQNWENLHWSSCHNRSFHYRCLTGDSFDLSSFERIRSRGSQIVPCHTWRSAGLGINQLIKTEFIRNFSTLCFDAHSAWVFWAFVQYQMCAEEEKGPLVSVPLWDHIYLGAWQFITLGQCIFTISSRTIRL